MQLHTFSLAFRARVRGGVGWAEAWCPQAGGAGGVFGTAEATELQDPLPTVGTPSSKQRPVERPPSGLTSVLRISYFEHPETATDLSDPQAA